MGLKKIPTLNFFNDIDMLVEDVNFTSTVEMWNEFMQEKISYFYKFQKEWHDKDSNILEHQTSENDDGSEDHMNNPRR